jgi:hypothetical protein
MFAAASEVTTGFNPITLIGTVITPVTVIILVMMGKFRTENEVRSLEAQNATIAQQLNLERERTQALQAGLIDQAVPALTRTTLVLERVAPLLERVSIELERVNRRRAD